MQPSGRCAGVLILAMALSGCVIGHQQFVSYQAPVKYPPVEDTWVFEYSDVDVHQLKDLLFAEFLTLAESSFVGPYEDPRTSERFASGMGADVFVVSTQFRNTQTSILPLTLPSTTTTSFSGSVGTRGFSGTATTYGTTTTMIPVSVDRYNQKGLYLRNVKKVKPLWVRTRAEYSPSGPCQFDGDWRNEKYQLAVYRSGNEVVGVIKAVLDRELRKSWSPDDLKFVFGLETGNAIYLMGNRSPMLARAKTNDFGFLEFELIPSGEKFSFIRE